MGIFLAIVSVIVAAENSSSNDIIDVIRKCKEQRDKCFRALTPGDKEGQVRCLLQQIICHWKGLKECITPCVPPFFKCVGMQWSRVQECAKTFIECGKDHCIKPHNQELLFA